MITTRDVLFLYNLFHWGGLIVLAIAACVIFYRVNPEFVKKYPFLIVLPGVLVFGLSYVGDLREKAKMERRAKAEEAEWHKRYDPAKARFDQLCQNAGEKIYRTADNVDGILLLKVRGDDRNIKTASTTRGKTRCGRMRRWRVNLIVRHILRSFFYLIRAVSQGIPMLMSYKKTV